MANRKDSFRLSVTTEEKEEIKKKAIDLGYATASSFLLDSSRSFFRLKVDMSVYRDLIREINYIGKNINSIVRRINSEKFFSDLDIEHLERLLEQIYNLMDSEYKRLGKLAFNFTSDDLDTDETVKIIEAYKKNNLPIPKHELLKETYEHIYDSLVFITELVRESKYQDETIEDYIWQFLYGKTLSSLSEVDLIKFSDKIYSYYEILKIKKIKLNYQFSDDDWFELLDILDAYEIRS